MKPYYSEGGITIYHGDCREELPLVGSSDCVIADPPYNVGIDYGDGHRDNMEPHDYTAWTQEWFSLARQVAWKMVVFPGHGNLPMWLSWFSPSAVGCWHKIGGGGRSILGVEGWEPWLYWCGDRGALGGNSVISARCESVKNGHPCPKPVPLIEALLVKLRVESVVDPFSGSGTTLVAAKRLGLSAVGIEIEERYCEIAANRLAQGVLNFE